MKPRIALYSHDALGLGHLRRNLAIARTLAMPADRSVLVVTGTREAAAFPLPAGVDVLTLPSFAKHGAAGYRPRTLRTTASRLRTLRATTIRTALDAFAPHVLIVDKHPMGLAGELEPALERLSARGTRFVLGLRDILDEPERAREEWLAAAGPDLVRDLYSDVWVYGDPEVYDVVREVGLGADAERKAHYTGYLGRMSEPAAWAAGEAALREAGIPEGPLAVCLVGGGEDGYALASAFARARLAPGCHGVVLTGPMMPAADRQRIRRQAGRRVRVLDFLPDPGPLLQRAESVVAMGGYNTVCELLPLAKRTLIVPRVAHRREQLIRARRLSARGVVDMLAPQDAGAGALSEWLAGHDERPRPVESVDLGGLARIPDLVERLGTPRGALLHAV